MKLPRHLLWIDGVAGLTVGAAVLLASGWLSDLYGLPRGVIVFLGAANLAYASYSLPLAMRSERRKRLIEFLAIANVSWAPICWGLAVSYGRSASYLGLAHLVGEGLFVATLGLLEWRWRDQLTTA